MSMIIQLVFGWPTILLFISLATFAAWKSSQRLMLLALLLSLPGAAYIFAGNGWIQLLALYIPASLLASIFFIRSGRLLLPKLLLLPVYAFYTVLAYYVLNQ